MLDVPQMWNSVGVPVLVAVLTTLVVEYFAKPRLEARKMRLTRDRQQIDEVIFAFQKVALIASSIIPDERVSESRDFAVIQRRQLEQLPPAVERVIDAVSRLPSHYVGKHSSHLGMTIRFVSFLYGAAASEMEKDVPDTGRIRQLGGEVSELDAYFAAHASFRDSQEPWIKRSSSRRFMAKEYREAAEALLERHGLSRVN